MRTTTLAVVPGGVLHHGDHARRLAAEGPAALAAFARFAASAAAGIYTLNAEGAHLEIVPRAAARLVDGLPVRLRPSPFATLGGAFPKPAAPSPYDTVRVPGVLTLLTVGDELVEACIAALVAWDGRSLVLPPDDRPRVASIAEAVLVRALPVRRAPLRTDDDTPLFAINAVACAAVDLAGRPPFPAEVRHAVELALSAPLPEG